MSLLRLQAFGQINDRDGLERALLHTYTTTNAQLLADVRQLAVWSHLNTLFALPDHGALLSTLLAALLGLAFLLIYDSDTSKTAIILLCLLLWPHSLCGAHTDS